MGLKVKKFNAEIEAFKKQITNLSKPTAPFSELRQGTNENTVLVCKIMSCFAIGADPVPVSFIVADAEGDLLALSIYHVNADVYSIMKVLLV